MLWLFRLPNLLIVALTQYLLQYLVLIPALGEAGFSPLLDHFHFFLLVFTTVLIAAGGYIINDIIDYDTDLINKPDRVIINGKISKNTGIIIYWLINVVGAVTSWYLAKFVSQEILFLIYPTAVAMLYFYSKFFKKMPLFGNIIVSIFCAGVAGIILFAERASYELLFDTQIELAVKITAIFTGYILFAFISTMLREIIKDMEDMEGDEKTGLKTFPIVFGLENAKKMSAFIAISMMVGLIYSCYWLFNQNESAASVFIMVGIMLPLFFIINHLIKSELKSHFSLLSKLTKTVMLAGLILLIIIWKF